MTGIIETDKLTKSYGEHRGIIEVDLRVDEGEAFGFLGPNGAGKTTTIRTLLDHIRPDVVHVMAKGRIVATGGPELALELERNGYRDYAEETA